MDNNITYIESEYDEFNTLPVANFYAQTIQEDVGVIVFKGFECLYPFFDYVFPVTPPKELLNMSYSERADYLNNASEITTPIKVKTHIECVNEIHPDTHIYKFLFGKFTEFLIKKGHHMFNAPYLDAWDVKIKLYSIDKPIVCINGRNLSKHTFRNNTFETLIKHLVDNDIFVINCTLIRPNLNIETNYIELDEDELNSYNRTLAYFEASDYVISVGNAGGISTLLMTTSNVIILGEGGWVDNKEFGFNGESMVSARQKHLPHTTIHIHNYEQNFQEITNIIKHG